MDSLIEKINQIQEACASVKDLPKAISLPQIVVVGTQSSGKSSIIESIVQREFLPRGTGIVTRRPLIIQLINTSNPSDWCKFSHKEEKFYDFDLVRKEIEDETERLCGNNKGICHVPIILTLYSQNVVDLTLVDLPGLTKNPVGDQPEDIETQIRELVMGYIKNQNSIILAVTAANTDFATSEAIKLAREVDPSGRRTLAVLTKLDIMDIGTDATDVLTGELIRIKLGIIGVVNRTQQDIHNKKSIKDAIESERVLLHNRYPKIAEKHGTPYLAKRLSHILMRHIRECLPELKLRINSLIAQYQTHLSLYGEDINDKAKTIIDLITKFALSYCDTIKGGKRQIKTTELCGGARIQFIFHDSFGQALANINPLDNLATSDILTAARNAAGVRTSICIPDVFELLVSQQIKRLEEPSLRCVELVHEEMGRFVRHCGDDVHLDLMRFPNLREKIESIVTRLLQERLPVTQQAVEDLVGYGSAFIDTEHPRLPEFLPQKVSAPKVKVGGDSLRSNGIDSNGNSSGAQQVEELTEIELRKSALVPRSDRELHECLYIEKRIAAYFNIVREEIKVFVPRAIMHCMVNNIKSNLHSALIKEIYDHDQFDYLLTESADIIKRRKDTIETLAALRKASEIISRTERGDKKVY